MKKRLVMCFVIAFTAMFGAAACGGGQQERIDQLEDQVDVLEERVEQIQVLLGMELMEEPTNEQTTGGETTGGGGTTSQ